MLAYVTELSKYIILILMIFYTVDAFVAVFKRKASGMLYIRQEVCLFLIQFFAYATISSIVSGGKASPFSSTIPAFLNISLLYTRPIVVTDIGTL